MNEEILLVDKPAGMSSFGVVARVRRKLTEEARELAVKEGRTPPKRVKVGHAGTLDPFATGLLILLVGKGTKRAGEFLKLDKEYVATVKLGEKSTTGDPEGEIVKTEQENYKIPNKADVEKLVESWPVENWQKVPEFSAVKINGQRAYKLARQGKKPEMPTRLVKIYKMEVLGYEWPELTIRCEVSSGTYIRALGEEIGEELGCGAYVKELRRTKIAEYRVEDAEEVI